MAGVEVTPAAKLHEGPDPPGAKEIDPENRPIVEEVPQQEGAGEDNLNAPAEGAGSGDGTMLPPPTPTPGASGTAEVTTSAAKNKKGPASQKAPRRRLSIETADETDNDERRKSGKKRAYPPIHSQMAALIERMDRQAERTDQLYRIIRPIADKNTAPTQAPAIAPIQSPPHSDRRSTRSHVSASYYKKRSPKNGRPSRPSVTRANSSRRERQQLDYTSSSESDVEEQVRQALDMIEPRFSKQKGNPRSEVDSVKSYRPFSYLDREVQREIMRSSHPEELTLLQHLTGLCAMASEKVNADTKVAGIINHMSQILEDCEYIQWSNVRSFSNTVITNVAKKRWSWRDDDLIERCRNNRYMRMRNSEDNTWAVPCPRYNKGRCDANESHSIGEVIMKHVCAYCCTNGFDNPHTLRACNRRKTPFGGNTKNRGSYDDKDDYKHTRHHQSAKNDTGDSAKN